MKQNETKYKDQAEWKEIMLDRTTDRLFIVIDKGVKKRGARATVWANIKVFDKNDWRKRMVNVKAAVEKGLDILVQKGRKKP